jgi:glutamyl-tRNA synthetase
MRSDPGRVADALVPFLERAGLPAPADRAWLGRVVDSLKERAKTLADMVEAGRFYFEAPRSYDQAAVRKFFTPGGTARLQLLVDRLESFAEFDAERLEVLYRGLAAEIGVKLVDFAQVTRLAVTGKVASPPIFQVVALLGRDETLARLRAALTAATPGKAVN